jgi:hypothetical protein
MKYNFRYVKYIHEMIWVSFVDNAKAVDAVALSPIEICGHEMTIRLKSPDWRKILDAELKLCSDQTLPLCGDKELNLRKESARLLSQLSQLSFEELGGNILFTSFVCLRLFGYHNSSVYQRIGIEDIVCLHINFFFRHDTGANCIRR